MSGAIEYLMHLGGEQPLSGVDSSYLLYNVPRASGPPTFQPPYQWQLNPSYDPDAITAPDTFEH